MKVNQLGEFGLIDRVRKSTPLARGVHLGIGDDAAWVKCRDDSFLITSDLLIEGVHFNLAWTSFYSLGYKSLAVNLSDIAAMGGTPAYLILSLGIPAHFGVKQVEEFYRGVRKLSSRYGVCLVGGDTNSSERFFVSVTLVGYAPYGAVTRSGARVGDDLYVTGTLGDSALGLAMLKKKRVRANKDYTYLASRHLFPRPRLRTGALLARRNIATAMIDISDGLLQDLGHICKASKVGAIIQKDSLPLSRAYRVSSGSTNAHYALTGGEDYELLFCVRPRNRNLVDRLQKRLETKVSRIGTCVPVKEGIRVLNHRGHPLSVPGTGYNHFKN